MKKIITFLFFTIISFAASAQSKPNWLNEDARNASFPANVYYTGFAYDNVAAGKSVQDVTQQMKTEAQADMAKQIRLQITSKSQSKIDAGSANGQYSENESFLELSQAQTDAKLADITVETYYDAQAQTVYAFAAVKRADLANYYAKQIDVDLSKVETALDGAGQLATSGKKMSARRKMQDAKQTLNEVTNIRDLLIAVNANGDTAALQTKRSSDLQHSVEQQLIDLEQSTAVFLDCSYQPKDSVNDAFGGNDPGIMCGAVKQALSENDCSITDDTDEADYKLTLVTSTTMRSNGSGAAGIITYYANVKGTLYNCFTKRRTAVFNILNDTDAYAQGNSAEQAATRAFKLPSLTKKVLDNILPKIKN